ncbi:MAG: hypothetical protein H7Z72_11215, partial [Bacteroidetes bacterium]|nr:hypothetical protein [Fibrella sp.]
QLRVQIDNVVGNQELVLGTSQYTNGSGEPFTVTTLNYYLSNFRFRRTDGSEYVVPQDSSYFLVKESDKASQLLTFRNLPVGDYSAVTFTIGVDSLRSTANISERTGVLNPAGSATAPNDMYWAWNSGYIFLKLEGLSPRAPVDATGLNLFQYHIGLFGIPINNTRTVSLPFGTDVAKVTTGQLPVVTLKANVLTIFDGSTAVSIAQHPEVMVNPFSATIANNYSTLFRYDHLDQTTY